MLVDVLDVRTTEEAILGCEELAMDDIDARVLKEEDCTGADEATIPLEPEKVELPIVEEKIPVLMLDGFDEEREVRTEDADDCAEALLALL